MASDLGINLPGGKIGILLLHELGSTAALMRPIAQGLARAGYTVVAPQLAGHDGAHGAPGGGGSGEWIAEAEEALGSLSKRCETVIVGGVGYGAMLALETARRHASDVHALMLIEPKSLLQSRFAFLPDFALRLMPQMLLARLIAGSEKLGAGRSTRQGTAVANGVGSPSGAPVARPRDIAVLLDCVNSGLASIAQPALVVHRRSPGGAAISEAVLLQRRLGGRVESVLLEDAGASAAAAHTTDLVIERAARFVAAVLADIQAMREKQLLRQRMAAGRSNAA